MLLQRATNIGRNVSSIICEKARRANWEHRIVSVPPDTPCPCGSSKRANVAKIKYEYGLKSHFRIMQSP